MRKHLSQRRAEAVRNRLVNKYKVPAGRVKAVAKATEGLIRPKSNRAAENRRLEFVFVSKVASKDTGLEEIEVL